MKNLIRKAASSLSDIKERYLFELWSLAAAVFVILYVSSLHAAAGSALAPKKPALLSDTPISNNIILPPPAVPPADDPDEPVDLSKLDILKKIHITTKRKIFHHPDPLSGTSVDTDEKGNLIGISDYEPYGANRIHQNYSDFTNPYLFTGKEKDNSTGLYYYGARYYDPVIGRFTTQDPWGGNIRDPQSFNKYSYARNNPLKYVDPNGAKLELVGSEQFTGKAFSDLQKLSPYIVNNGNSINFDYISAIKDFVKKEFKNPLGTLMLLTLINDDNTVQVNELKTPGGQESVAEHDKTFLKRFDLKNGKGVDSVVSYNQDNLTETPVYSPVTGKVEMKESPFHITLAHELIHAIHDIAGTVEKSAIVIYKTLNGAHDIAANEEVRTVGTDDEYKKEGDITENDIRSEQGLDLRDHY